MGDPGAGLPVGVEAYVAYALRARLARDHAVSAGARRFAEWPAIYSFALGMAAQVAYHLLAQAGAASLRRCSKQNPVSFHVRPGSPLALNVVEFCGSGFIVLD